MNHTLSMLRGRGREREYGMCLDVILVFGSDQGFHVLRSGGSFLLHQQHLRLSRHSFLLQRKSYSIFTFDEIPPGPGGVKNKKRIRVKTFCLLY